MNERIKELSLQAADEIADLFSPGFFDDRMVNDIAEINKKFAELIVRECADRGSKAMYPDSDPDYVGRKIREHFGIKE